MKRPRAVAVAVLFVLRRSEGRWERLEHAVAEAHEVHAYALRLSMLRVPIAPADFDQRGLLRARPVARELVEDDQSTIERLVLGHETLSVPGDLCACLTGLLPVHLVFDLQRDATAVVKSE